MFRKFWRWLCRYPPLMSYHAILMLFDRSVDSAKHLPDANREEYGALVLYLYQRNHKEVDT